MEIKNYRTWIEISQSALKFNFTQFRKVIGKKVLLLGVIKSNAYGHGLMTMARLYVQMNVDWLGVDSIAEANKLRKEKIIKPLLVLGYTQPENFIVASTKNISLAISTFEALKALSKFKEKIKIHIKIDTGMHRQGFLYEDLSEVVKMLKKMPRVSVEGLFTHFASAKDPEDKFDTTKQIELFEKAMDVFKVAGYNPICHAAATGGTLNFPESHLSMVRVGIGLYGLWPSSETKNYRLKTKDFFLKPILTWKSVISEIKWVEKNERVGYDYTEKLESRTRLAVIPIGYWHGFWRAFSSKAEVLVQGVRCKVIGRVSMDMIVVNVTKVTKVKVGDEVVLLGKQKKEEITADELAEIAGTSSYEIVTRLNPLIKKVIT